MLYLRHTYPSFLATSLSADVHSTYCLKKKYIPLLFACVGIRNSRNYNAPSHTGPNHKTILNSLAQPKHVTRRKRRIWFWSLRLSRIKFSFPTKFIRHGVYPSTANRLVACGYTACLMNYVGKRNFLLLEEQK